MEICRFPVVQKPLERVPLPPRVRSNSMSRTLPPASPSLEGGDVSEMFLEVPRVTEAPSAPAPLATKVLVSKVHRNIKMKVDPTTTTTSTPTTILPSPSSPGSYMPLPLPAIVPLAHQSKPFIVCSSHLAAASSPSVPSPSPSPSLSTTSSSSSAPSRQSAPFFVPISMVTNASASPAALMDPHLLHGQSQLTRSASTSPVPGSTSDQAGKKNNSDSKKRPRSASTPSGTPSNESSARSKRKRKTPEQLALLEKEFETNPMPNKDVREHLSQHLGLTSRQVQIWFQNKRAKVKNNRVSVPGGSQSPQEASSPEGSPAMSSPLAMDSPSPTSLSLSASSSVLSSSYPAPSSPSSFQQFSAIDSFFEPSYFDLLLDAPSLNGPTDFLQQQTA